MSFFKTTPTNMETARHFGLLIWLLLFPQKNTGVQVPPLKPPETLAVPTVPPFPRFLKSVTHWMTDNRDRFGVVDWRLWPGTAIDPKGGHPPELIRQALTGLRYLQLPDVRLASIFERRGLRRRLHSCQSQNQRNRLMRFRHRYGKRQ